MKKIYKYHLILTLIFSLFYTLCCAQLYVGPLIGLDFAKIQANPNEVGFQILEHGYKKPSLLLGFKLEQQFSNLIYISLKSTYTKKNIDATDRGFIPFKEIEFDNYKTSLAINWLPLTSFNIGIGLSYNYIPQINKIRFDETKEEIDKNRKELSTLFCIGYIYKHFLFEVNYYKSLKLLDYDKEIERNHLDLINSFEISLSYLFKIIEKNKGKKVSCPRF